MIINPYVFAGPALDPDAQAFITAAGLTDNTQKTAINTLVLSLKVNNIWQKFKAIYPFVGGTATTHKFNLINPADTNAAYRLTFTGGWTHSSTGALPNGTNAYANTYLDTQNDLSLNSGHFSFYSRTNAPTALIKIDMGALRPGPDSYSDLNSSNSNLTYFRFNNTISYNNIASTDSIGFYSGSRTALNAIKTYKNGSVIISGTAASSSTSNIDIYIGAVNSNGSPLYYANRECAFATIGTSLTDAETLNFYIAVETFQTALGRNIAVPIVSDSDAQAFLCAANITNTTQANAVNQLVIDMKAANIWTKMKAIYPMVGGTATTHKWNLKDPQDTNAAFRLVFNGGWTHSSTGAKPNGLNGYADTFLIPNTAYAVATDAHMSFYSRTNVNLNSIDIGTFDLFQAFQMNFWNGSFSNQTRSVINNAITLGSVDTNSLGFLIANRSGTTVKNFKNSSIIASGTNSVTAKTTTKIWIGAQNLANSLNLPSSRECAFASIGDGLTDTDAANLYTAVQAFNTTQGRQV
jgi:hypothetical protein